MISAIRRHHKKRLQKKRRFHFSRDLYLEPGLLSQVVDTPCSCSCVFCGNPRKYFGEVTRSEKKHQLIFVEEMKQWG